MSRASRAFSNQFQNQLSSTCMRLRNPIRNAMWMPPQMAQARNPAVLKRPITATAFAFPMITSIPCPGRRRLRSSERPATAAAIVAPRRHLDAA
jgi:hypothetical protein